MAHQINLYSPILLAPRRYFSARAMALSLALLALGLAALGAWAALNAERLQRELASAGAFHGAERTRLQQQLDASGRALPNDIAALEQELAREDAARKDRQQRLAELSRGLVAEGQEPSALLRMLARTVPAPIWLDDVRYAEGRLEVAGHTLQPEALPPWLAKVSADPVASAQPLALLKVERAGPVGAAQAWSFRAGPAARELITGAPARSTSGATR